MCGADEEAGDDEEDGAGGDLSGDEGLAGEGFALALASDLEGGGKSEEAGGQEADGSGKEKDAPIGCGAEPPGRVLELGEDDAHDCAAQHQAGNGAEDGEQKAFGQELAEEAEAAGANGNA